MRISPDHKSSESAVRICLKKLENDSAKDAFTAGSVIVRLKIRTSKYENVQDTDTTYQTSNPVFPVLFEEPSSCGQVGIPVGIA